MKRIINILVIVIFTAGFSHAKWWIFGKSKEEVGIKYMTINSVSAEETASKITLFKDMLPEGRITIKGKASGGQIGSVRVSIDGKASWNEAKFSENGAFEYSFTAEAGKKYDVFVEITNTAGKTNRPEETAKTIEISQENFKAKITETLNSLFEAYNSENQSKFMSYVSDNFAGDRDFLELAIKKDFNALSDIKLRYSINNFALGSGKAYVSLTYNRMFFINRTGQSSTDSGITEMVFELKDGKPLLYSMKKPLLFGLSDAENVATGETAGAGSGIELNETGDLGGSYQTVTLYDCASGAYNVIKYDFNGGFVACDTSGGGSDIWFYNFSAPDKIGYASAMHKEINKPLSSVTAAEAKDMSGFTSAGNVNPTAIGKTYVFYINNEFWGLEPLTLPFASYSGTLKASFKVKQF